MTKPGKITAMISATARDLPDHLKNVQKACLGEDIFPLWMEHLPTRDANGVKVSMEMVDDADIYIGIYAWRYGWVPEFDNPDEISITEMEFNRALLRKAEGKLKEILIFVMHDKHQVNRSDVETGEEACRKLKAFKERASDGRIRAEFTSPDDLRGKVTQALAAFVKRQGDGAAKTPALPSSEDAPIPTAPAFYAEPDYIGSHKFVGRQAELDALSDWANPSDQTNLLLFEAIGGNGKSMLTWEWAKDDDHLYATKVRLEGDAWAGRFWYSFYERGATMDDFCRRALAYMTGRPLEEFKKLKTAQMKDDLIAQLHERPWLLILDGLERVLVAYHRIDAAEVPDEEVNEPTDKVLNRDPCDAIHDEDDDLLRALCACAPSKILVSSRLTPRALLNQAGQAIQGAKRLPLGGLHPLDAEKLLRSCGKKVETDPEISGDSAAIQDYLRQNCDNHPLVIGVLAGLINEPGPNRGNFDAWSADPDGGAALDLSKHDLTKRRNHILRAAIAALGDPSRQLLSTLALLSESVDYKTLEAFNPHMPPEPEEVRVPRPPEKLRRWERMTDEDKAEMRERYEGNLARRKEFEEALKAWRESFEVREAPKKLSETVRDLEQRGLLQYDGRERRYDLHPVVRSVAVGCIEPEDKERFGLRVVDHFSSQPHSPYEQAQTMEDLSSGLHVVRTLLKLGHFEQAMYAYKGDLARALLFNLEAHADILSLLRPFFPAGWGELPKAVEASAASSLANDAAIALDYCGELAEARDAYEVALRSDLETRNWSWLRVALHNISENLSIQSLPARARRIGGLALDIAAAIEDKSALFVGRLQLFANQSRCGERESAAQTWRLLDPMGRSWSRGFYRQGDAEETFARAQFWQGTLTEDHLTRAANLAEKDNNRPTLRELHQLRGAWRLEQEDWPQAAAGFGEALRMARERRLVDEESETGLALAKFHLDRLTEDDARSESERLAGLRRPAHRYLAMLWLAIGDADEAERQALAAYEWAWAQGEPYVDRYELTRTTELLEQMNVPIPPLSPYDAEKDEPFEWEADVRAVIEELRAEKEAREAKKKAEEQEPD